MLSALIRTRRGHPAVRLAAQPAYRRSVHHGPLVLVAAPRKAPTPTIDRDRTVSRRSEPSSRATLMGEQPNPWDITMPQFPACSGCPPPSQAPFCHCTLEGRLPIGPRAPLEASVTLLEATTPVKLPAKRCPGKQPVRPRAQEGPYFNGGSTATGVADSKPPAYPTHPATKASAKLQ